MNETRLGAAPPASPQAELDDVKWAYGIARKWAKKFNAGSYLIEEIYSAAGYAYANALANYKSDAGPWRPYLALNVKGQIHHAFRSNRRAPYGVREWGKANFHDQPKHEEASFEHFDSPSFNGQATHLDVDAICESADLARNLHRLPERERRIVELRYLEDKELKEIGQAIGTTAPRASQLLKRALKQLRESYEREVAA
jgi:RNA polymerase sigma factor (sigma-70 family)